MHTLLDGRTIELGELPEGDRAYLDELARDAGAGAPYFELLHRVKGPRAHTTRATGGMVTAEVLASALYLVAQDIADRAGISQGKLAPPRNAQPAELLSVPEAANVLGVSRQAVNDAIARGRLHASKVGGTYVVRLQDLRAYEQGRDPRGRPPAAREAAIGPKRTRVRSIVQGKTPRAVVRYASSGRPVTEPRARGRKVAAATKGPRKDTR